MNAQKYFEQHAEELIARFAGKNVALFFAGWPSGRMLSFRRIRC